MLTLVKSPMGTMGKIHRASDPSEKSLYLGLVARQPELVLVQNGHFPAVHRYGKCECLAKLKRGWKCESRLICHFISVLNVRAFFSIILTEQTGDLA